VGSLTFEATVSGVFSGVRVTFINMSGVRPRMSAPEQMHRAFRREPSLKTERAAERTKIVISPGAVTMRPS
jgi:hypothetical protein